jgi:hypothetical protein
MTSAPHSRRYSSFRPLIFADPKKTQEQWTYIAQMGSRTAFKLDADATPRAEFTRVAVHYLGWVSYPMRNNHIHILSVQRTDAGDIHRRPETKNGAHTGRSASARTIGTTAPATKCLIRPQEVRRNHPFWL